jgi:histidine triad (HIT) family protein
MPEKEYSEEELKNMSAEEIAELQKQNCIFCKITAKEIPAKIIHEDSDTMCILDINPASEGHILVYPKKHYMIMPHMPEDIISKVFLNVKLMSHTLLKTLQCKGTTVFVANGVAAGQKAPHVLIHVFPRRENDGLVKLPQYEMSEEQIEKLRRDLRPYMNQLFGTTAVDEKMERKIIRDAEFSERKTGEHDKKIKGSDDDKAKKISDKKTEGKPEKGQKGKVDLNDIAKLFGG